ncbi:hypothetical protein E0Z10_g3008 [Xylaria hypoxylon]|uniref:Uncharacterized protein n=1 Tax=Xylaria hypoxylon TaxID=37992 RepID=A0A4Z0Z203_9PEZI|nr:hypothetical protein E0Z10_g3008 [Xylaria hypoxylon]
MAEFSTVLQEYKESFLQIDPSCIPEIACVFIGGSRLYNQEHPGSSQNSGQSNYDGIIVAKSKNNICHLIAERRQRQRILDLIGVEHQEHIHLKIPSPFSPLCPEFDGIQISGSDGANVKRSVTLLSLEYFSRNRTSLNVLSIQDRRVFDGNMPSVKLLHQVTTLGASVILHDQWLYTSDDDKTISAFGAIVDLIVSGACIYGQQSYGQDIKRILTNHYSSVTGSFPTVSSFAKWSRFSPLYVEWLSRELAELHPTSSNATINTSSQGIENVFLKLPDEPVRQFDEGLVSRQEGHKPQFSNNSSSYIVTTQHPLNSINIFVKVSEYAQDEFQGAKTASRYFPRISVPRMAKSGELLYPFFAGVTESDARLSYIRNGRQDMSMMESLLYVELVKAEDTLQYSEVFHDRLLDDRRMKEYYGEGITLGGETVSLDRLLSLRWLINDKSYPSLREAFDESLTVIAPNSAHMLSCPIAFGLGDAHGGNVMLNQTNAKGGTNDVLFIDYEVAGFHPIMLDLAKPLYSDGFYETLYQRLMPGKVDLRFKYRVSSDTDTIVIDFAPQLDSLAQAIMDIKLRYLVKPLCDEVRPLGVNLEDHVPLLSTALFLCATLARNFANSEQTFLSNFATGFILREARSWPQFASGLEGLGFKPRNELMRM